jgi:hypothetical protein
MGGMDREPEDAYAPPKHPPGPGSATSSDRPTAIPPGSRWIGAGAMAVVAILVVLRLSRLPEFEVRDGRTAFGYCGALVVFGAVVQLVARLLVHRRNPGLYAGIASGMMRTWLLVVLLVAILVNL